MYRWNDTTHNKHWIYLFDDSTPILLPSIFSRYTAKRGLSIELKSFKDRLTDKTIHEFKEFEISYNAQYVRGNQVGLFLEWIEEQESPESSIKLDFHTALPQDIINSYINEYLIETMRKSESAVNRAVYSLQSYYNWLHFFLPILTKR